jgi:hypothetical protein
MADVTKNMIIRVSQTGATEAAAGIAQVDKAQQGAAQSAGTLGKATNSLTNFVREERREHRTQNFLFKESREVVTGLAFSMMALSSSAGEGNDSLRKLNQTMIMGFTGFQATSFAMSALGVATGGTATAIAMVIGIGAGLLTFFNDTKEAAKAAALQVEGFSETLEDMTLKQLERQRVALQSQLDTLKATKAANETFVKSAMGNVVGGAFAGIFGGGADDQIALDEKKMEILDKQIKNVLKTDTKKYYEDQAKAIKTAADAASKLNDELERYWRQFRSSGQGNIGYAGGGNELTRGFEQLGTKGFNVPDKLTGVQPNMTEQDFHEQLRQQAEIAPGSDFWYDTMRDFTKDFGMTLAQEGMNAMEKIFGRADSLLEKLLMQLAGGMMEKGGQAFGDYLMKEVPRLFLASQGVPSTVPSVRGGANITINAVDAASISKMLANPDNASAFASATTDRSRKRKVNQ